MAEDMERRLGSNDPIPVLEIRSPIKVRMIGANFDVSLLMTTAEDFEIVERLLAREKAHRFSGRE